MWFSLSSAWRSPLQCPAAGRNPSREFRGTVATVNGQPITANELTAQLVRDSGPKSLSSLIEQSIIMQWAKDEKVPVTDAEINAQIDTLKRDGMYEDQVKAVGEEGLKSMLQMRQAMINLQEKLSPGIGQQSADCLR